MKRKWNVKIFEAVKFVIHVKTIMDSQVSDRVLSLDTAKFNNENTINIYLQLLYQKILRQADFVQINQNL